VTSLEQFPSSVASQKVSRRQMLTTVPVAVGAGIAASLADVYYPASAIDYASGSPGYYGGSDTLNLPGWPASCCQKVAAFPAKKNWEGAGDYESYDLGRGSGLNVADMGCATFACFQMYKKSGARPMDMTYDDFYKEWNTNALAKGHLSICNEQGGLVWGQAEVFADGKFHYEGRGTPSVEGLRQVHEAGKLAIIGVLGENHWVLLDYVEGNDVYIIDSGWGNAKLGDAPFNNNPVTVHVYTTTSTDLPKMSDIKDGNGSAKTHEGEKKDENKDGQPKDDTVHITGYEVKSEEDLVGMESYKELKKKWDEGLGRSDVKAALPSLQEAQRYAETQAVASHKERREAQEEPFSHKAMMLVRYIGVGVTLWSIAIVLAALLDKFKPMFNFNFTYFATLTKFRYVEFGEDSGFYDGKMHATWGQLFGFALIFLVLGVLMWINILEPIILMFL